ncbi:MULTISPECIES: Ig-like domain-containing protein [unclassified Gilliamella]|uniref:Ig-like domain-containing protein n=1 Tax=unclassified Gilliamella TaxID=2685620 RepID=UPI00130CD5F2|nr:MULTISPECIES: Ig-like domain-containing protein [unclassified Gilliamella]MWP48534.1 hypothetical protein [Gilliamella sp. Lep-s35]MWP68596.1 hypothetical protein [Gilliamella sp. Lep-s5]MWP76736.1 hypothetical protein [Gilliamella sp. Lep-s21]
MSKTKTLVADAQLSVLSINKEQIVANGTDQAVITIQLKDSDGNDIKNLSSEYKVALISESKSILSALTSNDNGTYTCTVSTTNVGAETFSFSVNDVVNQNSIELKYIEEKSPGLPPLPPDDKKTQQQQKGTKNDTKVKVIVEFICPFSRYSRGDIAGFEASYAKELVETRNVAKLYKK